MVAADGDVVVPWAANTGMDASRAVANIEMDFMMLIDLSFYVVVVVEVFRLSSLIL